MMTAPKPMTRRELIELAALDALGLLDEYEASLYTRSFHHAPTAVQNELLELQAKIASDPMLLPADEPDPSLRERVIDFVSEQVEAESPDLTPLATIGNARLASARQSTSASDVLGRIGRSNPLWRVATFTLCGMVVVMAYFWADAVNQQSALARIVLDRDTATQLESLVGPTISEYLFDPTVSHIVLASPDGTTLAQASLFVKAGTELAILVMNLPETTSEVYELTVTDAQGQVHHLARFAGQDRLAGMHVAVNAAALAPGCVWQINGPEGVLLRSA